MAHVSSSPNGSLVTPRIRVIDKPNGGLSSARNAGILAAQTDYVCFLDSDDRFHQNACEEMVRLLDKTEADVLTFGATCYPEDAAYPWLTDVLNPRDAVFDGFTPDILFKEKSRPFAWRTACRTEFLIENQLMFEEGLRFGEIPEGKKNGAELCQALRVSRGP